mmetsp:Transcript_15446/g.39083  ORF Transcript_15446/g.39083 Transcript_15446/m.39083 type:complete len:90 (+) Transcript_15446:112-381(+)
MLRQGQAESLKARNNSSGSLLACCSDGKVTMRKAMIEWEKEKRNSVQSPAESRIRGFSNQTYSLYGASESTNSTVLPRGAGEGKKKAGR